MDAKGLIAVCFSDLAGQMRGHGVPRAAIKDLYRDGLAWPDDSATLTAFGEPVESPWTCAGGLRLLPDIRAEVRIDFGEGAHDGAFVLADMRTDDDQSWGGCTRSFLRATLVALKTEFGLDVSCSYEHQFTLDGGPRGAASAMSLGALRRHRAFAGALATVLENAGITLLRFGAGTAEDQFCAVTQAQFGVAAADGAVAFRQLAHATAERLGQQCSFAPLPIAPAGHNRVILGLDLFDEGDQMTYDPAASDGISATLGSFLAGISRHLPALRALTCPSFLPAANGAANGNGVAKLALPAVPAVSLNPKFSLGGEAKRDYSLAYRAADATACPYLQLGAVLCAGLSGLRDRLPTPAAPNGAGRGYGQADEPSGLGAALDALAGDAALRAMFPDHLLDAYQQVKRTELAAAARLSPEQLCAWGREIY